MKFPCSYHPLKTSRWHCEPCERFYCDECVPCGNEIWLRMGGAKCALCFKRLDYLGSAVDAPPPTQEILNCIKYPLQTDVLFVLIPLSLILALISLGGPLLAGYTMVPFLAFCTAGVEFASSIFLARSEGKKQAPALGSIGQKPDLLFFMKHAVLLLIGINLVYFTQQWLFAVLYLVILPASVMILVYERSLTSALHPGLIFGTIRALGRNYWIAFGFCLVVLIATKAAYSAAPGAWPFIFFYSLYVCYAYLGYLAFYHQYELSRRVPKYEEEFVSKIEFEKRRALSDSFILLKENQMDRAREVLKAGFKRCNDDLQLHIQYHKILLKADDKNAIRNHSDFVLERAVNSKQLEFIPQLISDTFHALPDYKPRVAAFCLAAAQQCRHINKHQIAIKLLKDFHQHFPDSSLITEAYLLAAEIFHKNLGENSKALFLVDYLLQQSSNGALQNKVQLLKNQLSKAQ